MHRIGGSTRKLKLQIILETFSFPRSTCNVEYFVHYIIIICAFQGHHHVVRHVST